METFEYQIGSTATASRRLTTCSCSAQSRSLRTALSASKWGCLIRMHAHNESRGAKALFCFQGKDSGVVQQSLRPHLCGGSRSHPQFLSATHRGRSGDQNLKPLSIFRRGEVKEQLWTALKLRHSWIERWAPLFVCIVTNYGLIGKRMLKLHCLCSRKSSAVPSNVESAYDWMNYCGHIQCLGHLSSHTLLGSVYIIILLRWKAIIILIVNVWIYCTCHQGVYIADGTVIADWLCVIFQKM